LDLKCTNLMPRYFSFFFGQCRCFQWPILEAEHHRRDVRIV
jgi:hypothetical protein